MPMPNRKHLPREINMHSVKNRFLLRIKNATPRVFWRHALSMGARDSLVMLACMTHEFYSLKAFALVWKLLPRAMAKRSAIMQRRRASDIQMEQWFAYKPAKLACRFTGTHLGPGVCGKSQSGVGFPITRFTRPQAITKLSVSGALRPSARRPRFFSRETSTASISSRRTSLSSASERVRTG